MTGEMPAIQMTFTKPEAGKFARGQNPTRLFNTVRFKGFNGQL